ncbi:hypothetical protein EJ06DRAFT_547060 [Trichodelitschia bisporula]|uniref:PX domain-containing protein n=1 Tax=Trichodelitschia bisporula TaxID=703511 RepID=A0A6G1I729_9PEZI|nr:hypothetical protein EJ06DRAFT_547060 [Trichodelitschia bisporula]
MALAAPDRSELQRSSDSYVSLPPPGALLTGKQEHYLKRELISRQTAWEISELNSPTALRRFGAPFKSDAGEVKPQDSELPILRFIFVHHVRTFPFLRRAQETEFWQNRVQVFLESFASKHISSSEDRLEDTKRRKLALKARKLVEIMMVSGIPTASGYEERIRFAELEVVDRGAQEKGLIANVPHGHEIHGWDVNVAGVRTVVERRHWRNHNEPAFIIRVKRAGHPEHFVVRRYEDFKRMHEALRIELAGKVLPPLPRKNTDDIVVPSFIDDSDSASSGSSEERDTFVDAPETSTESFAPARAPSVSSARSMEDLPFRDASRNSLVPPEPSRDNGSSTSIGDSLQAPARDRYKPSALREQVRDKVHRRKGSAASSMSRKSARAPSPPRPSTDIPTSPRTPTASHFHLGPGSTVLFRESQRVSLRAALRTLLANEQVAQSNAMREFLTIDPVELAEEDVVDCDKRRLVDEKRVEEQRRFYEVARQRAAELDVHMEKFRRDIVERNGLRKLFSAIKEKKRIEDLPPEYQKFAEWLRIEIAATIYHLFLAEDNSAELFAQMKRIHSLIPYSLLKNIIRFANPAALMPRILDVFMAQPFGSRSLLQHIFGMAIQDGITGIQKAITTLITQKIQDPTFPDKIQAYAGADEVIKQVIKQDAEDANIDIVLAILRSDLIDPVLPPEHIEAGAQAYLAWKRAVEEVGSERLPGAQLYAHLKLLLKLYVRQRDKVKMLEMINEPNSQRLLRDLIEIFYEPLMRVYKAANVYNSVTDFASFVDDIITTVTAAQRAGLTADPNQTVQSFIDLCARHQDNFYKFVHECHVHDDGLFDRVMAHLETILEFLRIGPRGGALDMNALVREAMDQGAVDPEKLLAEVNALVKWHVRRKRWHADKTRRKMAADGEEAGGAGFSGLGMKISAADFGVEQDDLDELEEGGSETEEEEEDEGVDGIVAERRRRARQAALRAGTGEPVKPVVSEVPKLMGGFVRGLRGVLAD